MGLAVLPARLDKELKTLSQIIVSGGDICSDETIAKHGTWVESFIENYEITTEEDAMNMLRTEVGKVFEKVLEHSGVFKRSEEGREAFVRFIETLRHDV